MRDALKATIFAITLLVVVVGILSTYIALTNPNRILVFSVIDMALCIGIMVFGLSEL